MISLLYSCRIVSCTPNFLPALRTLRPAPLLPLPDGCDLPCGCRALQQGSPSPGGRLELVAATTERAATGILRRTVPQSTAAAAHPDLITAAQCEQIFGRAITQEQLADLNACLKRFEIDTPARITHFLAQIAHESGACSGWRSSPMAAPMKAASTSATPSQEMAAVTRGRGPSNSRAAPITTPSAASSVIPR